MKTNKRLLLTLAVAASTAAPLSAYNDTTTHPHLTLFSAQKSALYQDGALMFALGLPPVDRQLYDYRARVDGSLFFSFFFPVTIQYQVSTLIGEGAYDEDQGGRPSAHFFDPVFMRGLTVPGYRQGEWSYIWALEPNGEVSINFGTLSQKFSLADARTYLNTALTASTEKDRKEAMKNVYLSLGHAAHHIQDMAQPQHTRNDIHIDNIFLAAFPNLHYNPSLYETYTQEVDATLDSQMAAGSPVFPGGGFKIDSDFWLNPGQTGIAQDTNSKFVSQGTNFTLDGANVNVGTYASPVPIGSGTPIPVTTLFANAGKPVPADIKALCADTGIDCSITYYSTATSARASTLSIFDQDLRLRLIEVPYTDGIVFFQPYKTDRIFSLNRFNFDDAHTYLLRNAVSYSSGLINHFFRGKLDVFGPETGPYAIVDQSLGKGFTKVKLRVKNTTPNEALTGGQIQAIAKFHRNGCYQADLSGEFTADDNGNLITPCPNYRSEDPEVRMTTPKDDALGVDEMKEITFEFNGEIPLDATDLIIQVYYRGTVGDQANDFAIGAVDVSEPTWIAVVNGTDVFELSGSAFYYYTDIIQNIAQPPYSIVDINKNGVYDGADVPVRGGDIHYDIKVNGDVAGSVTLGEGRFARLAALVNPSGLQLTLTAIGNGFGDVTAYNMGAKLAQVDYSRNAYIVSPLYKLRSQTYQWDSVTYYHYYPNFGTPLKNMPPSKANDATTAVPVDMAH